MRHRIAVVISEIFLRRLTPALFPFVQRGTDYWIIDIARPHAELRRLLTKARPAGVLTEDLAGKTEAILDVGLPTVIADTDVAREGAIGIDVDDWEVGRRAADFLWGNGFAAFAFVGNGTAYSRQREEGFRQSLKEKGAKAESFLYKEGNGIGYMEHHRGRTHPLKQWLKSLPRPVAIFAAHDPLGRVICEVCEECRLGVPEDVAVVAVNNDELLCNLSYPPLSSMMIPWERIGTLAASLLEGLIQSGEHSGELFKVQPGDVIARQSSDFTAVDDPVVRRVMNCIRQQYQNPLTVEGICHQLNLNRRTLELRFKATLGESPRKVLEKQRVSRAKELLATSHLKMEWIAQQCGFHDAERLSVVFGKVTGEAPSSYRKRLQSITVPSTL